MKMVQGSKSGYESPQVQFIDVCEDVLRASFGTEDYDFSEDTKSWY